MGNKQGKKYNFSAAASKVNSAGETSQKTRQENHYSEPTNPPNTSSDLNSHKWFYGVYTEEDVESCLLSYENEHGAFLIRDGDATCKYYLDVCFGDKKKKEIKHYPIQQRGNYIYMSAAKFASLPDLVSHYTDKQGELCCKLGLPAVEPQYDTVTTEDEPAGPVIYETSNHPSCSPKCKSAVAIFPYTAREDQELTIANRELLHIMRRLGAWSYVHKVESTETAYSEGYVPQCYIALDGALDSYSWYFGKLSIREASNVLASDENHHEGYFLVRESETVQGRHTISMNITKNGARGVRNIRVCVKESNVLYLYRDNTFSCLPELIQHYLDGKDPRLRFVKPCHRHPPTIPDLSHLTQDKWQIPRNTLQLGNCIGEGHFSYVFEGLWKRNTEVAVKKPKPEIMDKREFMEEASTMKKLSHKNLLPLYGVCTDKEDILIVIELMPHGNLADFLRQHTSEALGLEVLLSFAFQIANGMAYLEKENFVHCDLAARNVLVGRDNVCKISDFGLTRTIKDELYDNSIYAAEVAVRWAAPEILDGHQHTTKSDVWAFGILLIEIMTSAKEPYANIGKKKKELKSQLLRGYRLPKPAFCPENIYDIITTCWEKEASDRPAFETLKYSFENYKL